MEEIDKKSPWFWFFGLLVIITSVINIPLFGIGFLIGLSWSYFHAGFISSNTGLFFKKMYKKNGPKGIKLD